MIGTGWNQPSGRSETLGVTVSGATNGTAITAGGSANTKGSWVDIGGTTSFDYNALLVNGIDASAAGDFVFDIGINVGGAQFVIAENLRFTTVIKTAAAGFVTTYLPLFVKAGAQLAARCAASVLSLDFNIGIAGFSNGIGGARGFSRCRALYTPSSSRGVAIDPGGSIDTKGAYSELVASSGFNASALMMSIGANGDVARTANGRLAMDLAIGASGSEQVFLSNYYFGYGVNFDIPFINHSPIFPFYIPSSTRIAARAQNSDNTAGDRLFDLAIWGFEA